MSSSRTRGWVAIVLVAAVTMLAGFAIPGNLPWLIGENRRIEPWKLPMVWSSEIMATLAFLRYALGAVLPPGWLPESPSRWTAKVFLLGLGIDLGLSMYEMGMERWSYFRAIGADAQVVSGHGFDQPTGHRRYSFSCAFRDQAGQWRGGWHSLLRLVVPEPVRAAIDQGKLPAPMKILYDPSRPERSWIAEVPFSDNNRVYLYSLSSLLLSGLITALFAQSRTLLGLLFVPPPETGPLFGGLLMLTLAALLQGW